MNISKKRFKELTAADLARFPVWQFTNSDELECELLVRPVAKIPVRKLDGRLVATKAILANGKEIWTILGNIDLKNARITKHFITLSVLNDEQWFSMARYHDFDWDRRGPAALAKFLGLSVEEIFPISYDVSGICDGDPSVLSSGITQDPEEKLSRAEVIALAVP